MPKIKIISLPKAQWGGIGQTIGKNVAPFVQTMQQPTVQPISSGVSVGQNTSLGQFSFPQNAPTQGPGLQKPTVFDPFENKPLTTRALTGDNLTQPGVKGDCPEGYVDDGFGNCNPDPNYQFPSTQPQQTSSPTLMTEEEMQEEADKIWMGQGRGSKGQPIVGTTNASGEKVGGVGANVTSTTTKPQTKKTSNNLFNTVVNVADRIALGLGLGETWARMNEKRDAQNWLESQKRKQMFTGMTTATSRGNIQTNTGKQAPNLGGQNLSFQGMYGKYGGEFNASSKKVMIDEIPDYVKMAYGGQTKYGLNIARTDGPYGAKPVPHAPDHVSNTVSETKTNEPKKLEAEKGEYLWKVGDGTIHYIDGKKHHDGGTKLTSSQVDSTQKPEVSSFIFSDHLKLPSELVRTDFNYETSKRKVSPAEVAGKYELNKYQAILDSKNSDKLDKTTAQLMVDKNTKQLAKLAVIHEAIKGEQPPQFAMEMLGEVPTAKLGGYIQDKYLPHFQTQGVVSPSENNNLTDTQYNELVSLYDIAEKSRKKSDVLNFQKKYHEYMPQKALDIILSDPQVTQYGLKTYKKYGIKTIEDLKKLNPDLIRQSNEEGLWGRRTEQYRASILPPPPKPIEPKIGFPEEPVKPKDKGPALKYTPPEKIPQKLPPFDFTTPAKMKMIASGIGAPIYEPPINPFIAGKQQRFWFNDWQAAAQQAQATGYKAPMETITAYTPAQGIGSMGSLFSGRTADLIGTQIVPQTGQANVAIANQAEAANAQEARRVELFNTAQKEDQRRETAILNQQYNNSLRDFVNNMVDTYGLAWTERGDLYDTNMLTNYYKDPRSGKTKFKGQPGNIFGAGYSYPGSSSGSGSYASLYKQNLNDLEGTDLTPEERKKEAMWMTRKLFGDDDDDYETTSKKRKRKTT